MLHGAVAPNKLWVTKKGVPTVSLINGHYTEILKIFGPIFENRVRLLHSLSDSSENFRNEIKIIPKNIEF